MAEHTPTPWKVGWRDRGHGHGDFGILSAADDGLIAKLVGLLNDRENVYFIVRACNAHDELAGLARDIVTVVDHNGDLKGNEEGIIATARAALTDLENPHA